jgi:hypothetical protein
MDVKIDQLNNFTSCSMQLSMENRILIFLFSASSSNATYTRFKRSWWAGDTITPMAMQILCSLKAMGLLGSVSIKLGNFKVIPRSENGLNLIFNPGFESSAADPSPWKYIPNT